MPKTSPLTHLDAQGRLHMVDIGAKPETERVAIAAGRLVASPTTIEALWGGNLAKGDALQAARLAGIMAAKKTGELIPLCHPLPLTQVEVHFSRTTDAIEIEATARCIGRTGVEMEAMVATGVAGLTLYDMAKSLEKGMRLDQVRLIEKRGGKSGHWRRHEEG